MGQLSRLACRQRKIIHVNNFDGKDDAREKMVKTDPFRVPDWRYRCAEAICRSSDNMGLAPGDRLKYQWLLRVKQTKSRLDFLAYFLAAYSVIYESNSVDADFIAQQTRKAELRANFGDIVDAYEIYSDENRSGFRAELEARILAKESCEDISDRLGISIDAVEAYQQYFFDVADRLRNKSYIHQVVLNYNPNKGVTRNSFNDQLRYWGYHAGSKFLSAFLHQSDVDVNKSQDDTLDDLFLSMLKSKTVSSLAVMEVNKFNIVQLLQMHADMYYKKLEASKNQSSQTNYDTIIQNIMTVAEWRVGSGSKAELLDTPLGRYYETSAELRAVEMVDLAAGEQTDLSYLEDIEFPEPRQSEDTNEDAK